MNKKEIESRLVHRFLAAMRNIEMYSRLMKEEPEKRVWQEFWIEHLTRREAASEELIEFFRYTENQIFSLFMQDV